MPKTSLHILLIISALSFFASITQAQITEDDLLIQRLMLTQVDKFRPYLLEPDKYEIQIIYTQIVRDSANQPFLREFTFNHQPQKYFNPASLVKLPVALLSLEKLNEQNLAGINKYTRIGYGVGFSCQTPVIGNNILDKAPPSLARYLEKMLLVSDNESYTRLYEFVGQRYIHQKIRAKNYENLRIIRRFNECDTLQNRHTNPIFFYNDNCELLHTQHPEYSPQVFYNRQSNWTRPVPQNNIISLNPDYENFLPLKSAHDMLTAIMLPEALPEIKRFNLTENDYQFLRRSLGAYPREGKMTAYQVNDGYFDTYKKYLCYGRSEAPLPYLRSFNIVGWWAGYVSDCAYFVDKERGIEFLVSAVISTNQLPMNEGDGYQKISFPFMRDLGKLIYEYEKQRPRLIKPNLNKFWVY